MKVVLYPGGMEGAYRTVFFLIIGGLVIEGAARVQLCSRRVSEATLCSHGIVLRWSALI